MNADVNESWAGFSFTIAEIFHLCIAETKSTFLMYSWLAQVNKKGFVVSEYSLTTTTGFVRFICPGPCDTQLYG